jgi:succinate dehydrogenase flavin-adding protein (antitoxin of CptAB toxin-antitoxin module)
MLLLLMEFRNQFLHNINCNSFETAVKLLDGQKNKLLKFDDLTDEREMELRLKNAYRSLHVACLDIVLGKYDFRRSQLEARRKVVTDMAEYTKLVMDSDTDLLSKIMAICVPEQGDSTQMITLKLNVCKLIDEHTSSFKESAAYLELAENLHQHLEPDQMKAFFVDNFQIQFFENETS